MNQQFQTRFLLEELDEFESLRNMLLDLGADKDAAEMLVNAVAKGHIEPSQAVDMIKNTTGLEEDGGAPAAGGGSTTGGGVTNGATFTPGAGEQTAGKRAFKKVKQKSIKVEDAPMLAHGKADISTYTQDGFTKAEGHPKDLTWVEPKDLWGTLPTAMSEDDYDEPDFSAADNDGMTKLSEARNYHQFKKEAAIRTKPQQMHEAAKMIHKKLEEISKLLEFTNQMRSELSEGEEQLEYKHNTKKLFEKINTKVVETYAKVKKLK